jgi:RES domain-containing protein
MATPSHRPLPEPRLHPASGIPQPHRAGRRELLWRICIPADVWRPPHAAGRWHRAGEPMVYAAASPALAALEALAHRDGSDLRQPHRLGCIELPEGPQQMLREEELDPDWLHDEQATRAFGSAWLRGQTGLLLFVPSALVPDAYNVLINAGHPAWQPERLRNEVRAFRFDPRLF